MWKLLGIILLVSLYQQHISGYRILCIFPASLKSHFLLAEGLVKALAERGHRVDMISYYAIADPPPNYSHINISTDFGKNKMSYAELLEYGKISLRVLTNMHGKSVCEQMSHPLVQKLIQHPPNDPPYDLVITEMFVSPCWLIIGHLLNIPTIGYVPTFFYNWLNHPSGNPLNTAYMSNSFSAYGQRMSFLQRLVNTVGTHVIIAQANYYMSEQDEQLRRLFGSDAPSTYDLSRNVSLYLVNSHYTISDVRPWFPTVIEIAGLHVTQKSTQPLSGQVKKFLDESTHGCVYFSFGTVLETETIPHEILNAFYAAFRNIAPVRVLMRAADKSRLPPGLPDNVMIQPWFLQLEVLKHNNTRAFITHGGSTSAIEAIVVGIPMVGIPLFGDQFINTKNLVDKNVAVSLDFYNDLTEDKITNAITTILHVPSYTKNVERISKMFLDRPVNPLDTAIYWIEYIGKYGYIFQSPGTYLTWWQQDLLDVYAALALAAILIVYLLLRIFKALARCVVNLIVCHEKRDLTESKKTK